MGDLGTQAETTVQTDLPEGYRATELGPLPEDWEVVGLEGIVEFTRKPRGLRISDLSEVPFIPMESIPADGTSGCGYVLKDGGSISSGTYCEPGDILLAKITPSLENGKQGVVPTELPDALAMATTEVFPLKPKLDLLDRTFLFFYLLYGPIRRDLASKMEGSTGRQRLPKHVLSNLLVPLPRLPEQQTIAYVLRTVQKAIATTEQVIASTKELKRSLMNHLFTCGPVPVDEAEQVSLKETEIGPEPKHWKLVDLGSLIAKGPQNGLYKPASDYGNGAPILRIDAFDTGDTLSSQHLKRLKLTEDERKKYELDSGDIVVNRVNGSLDLLGKCAIVGQLPEPTVFESNMMKFAADTELISSKFLLRFLCSSKAREQIVKKARIIHQASINQQDLKSLLVGLPPLSEQEEVVRTLDIVDQKLSVEENRKRSLAALFKTLLHNFMSGRLRISDDVLSEVEGVV